jgi:hypothetical protein
VHPLAEHRLQLVERDLVDRGDLMVGRHDDDR